jgi:hypothetical protein
MKYEFKQAVHIRPKGRPGKNYGLGIHEVGEEVEYDPYFLRLVQAGLILEVDQVKAILPKSDKERAQSTLEKVLNRKRGVQVKLAAKAEVDVDPVQPLVDSVSALEEAPSDHGKKKKSKG